LQNSKGQQHQLSLPVTIATTSISTIFSKKQVKEESFYAFGLAIHNGATWTEWRFSVAPFERVVVTETAPTESGDDVINNMALYYDGAGSGCIVWKHVSFHWYKKQYF
jgi:hypothetical protein